MILTFDEIIKWFGVTAFEILMILVSLAIYTVLMTLKVDNIFGSGDWMSWWTVHSPLFVCDALLCYFCIIVFIRQYLEAKYKIAVFRAVWSFNQILLMFLAQLLLCFKLEGQKNLTNSEVLSPIFILLILLLIRACRLH
ncbi:transmembrane protein 203-like [Oppia nitens]|uniref:transmembrane protein 203-like n=1 Tax=Oppia nitens TaxID=1686743 RepID=UPI0023DB6E0D|nr:transmembrane protein 203-like [Oppia nitens]